MFYEIYLEMCKREDAFERCMDKWMKKKGKSSSVAFDTAVLLGLVVMFIGLVEMM